MYRGKFLVSGCHYTLNSIDFKIWHGEGNNISPMKEKIPKSVLNFPLKRRLCSPERLSLGPKDFIPKNTISP